MCYLTLLYRATTKLPMFDPMPEELLVFSLINLLSFLGILTTLIRWLFSGAGKVEVKQRGMQKEIRPGPVGIWS